MRPSRHQISRVLAAHGGLTVRAIAEELGVTSRDVQLVVCNAINARQRWLLRNRWTPSDEYVYSRTAV